MQACVCGSCARACVCVCVCVYVCVVCVPLCVYPEPTRELQLAEATAAAEELGKQLSTAQEEKESAVAQGRQAEQRARQSQDLAARENERLQHNLANAGAQLAVLMDTIETLQGSTPAEQRVAQLTSKLSAAQAAELQLQLCNAQLHHELEDRLWHIGHLQTQVQTLQEQESAARTKLSAAQQALDVEAREVHALKGEVAEAQQQLAHSKTVQQQQQRRMEEVDDEVASLKRCLEEQRHRHAAQMQAAAVNAEEEQERQRSRALVSLAHEQALATQRELVEYAVQKALISHPPVLPRLSGAGAAAATDDAPAPGAAEGMLVERWRGEVRERMTAAITEMSVQVTQMVRSKVVMEWQMGLRDRKVAALGAALDAALAAQSLAESRSLALQQRARNQHSAEDSHAWSRVEALEHRVKVLSRQVQDTNARALQLAAALAQAQHDKESSSAALQALQRKELSVAADHADALALHTEHTLAASEAKAQELDAALKDFVRTEVLALLATEDEEARDAALALSEQLCVQQAKERVLLDRVAAMQQRGDVLRRQLAACRESLARSEQAPAGGGDKAEAARAEDLTLQRDAARADVSSLTADLEVLAISLRVRARAES